jgi:hypothetical protein
MQTESIPFFSHIHISQMEPQINAAADVNSSTARKMMYSKHSEKRYKINNFNYTITDDSQGLRKIGTYDSHKHPPQLFPSRYNLAEQQLSRYNLHSIKSASNVLGCQKLDKIPA